jgi:hypothetical protein
MRNTEEATIGPSLCGPLIGRNGARRSVFLLPAMLALSVSVVLVLLINPPHTITACYLARLLQ